ncbi:MAG: anti-sigma factor [Betaproteobacteria bacterium]|nr:anti-sigma factor [Betaproteobacteria bacterium]
MKRLSPDIKHALAAGYVLGTLRGRARSRFDAMAATDGELARFREQWEAFLVPLAGRVAPVAPPSRVWRAIEARIARPRERGATGIWSSLAFWRWIGAGLAAAAVALLVLSFGLRAPVSTEPLLVAVLATPEQVPRIVVEQPREGLLRLRMVKPWPSMQGRDLELWVIPQEGKPRSLGVVPADRDAEVRLAGLEVKLQGGVAFAVSSEPAGGSPTGQPTGKVLCSGAIARGRRA